MEGIIALLNNVVVGAKLGHPGSMSHFWHRGFFLVGIALSEAACVFTFQAIPFPLRTGIWAPTSELLNYSHVTLNNPQYLFSWELKLATKITTANQIFT